MSFQPMYDRVLLKRKDAETQTKGGLFIPTGSQEKSHLCTVVAVGEGRLNDKDGTLTPLRITVGQTVLIGKWSGDEVKIKEIDHLLIREGEILAVVKE